MPVRDSGSLTREQSEAPRPIREVGGQVRAVLVIAPLAAICLIEAAHDVAEEEPAPRGVLQEFELSWCCHGALERSGHAKYSSRYVEWPSRPVPCPALDEPPARPITFRAAEDLGPFELAQLWADRTAWPLDERTQYDELSELAVMSALGKWLPIAIHSAMLAGARPEAVAGALGNGLQVASIAGTSGRCISETSSLSLVSQA